MQIQFNNRERILIMVIALIALSALVALAQVAPLAQAAPVVRSVQVAPSIQEITLFNYSGITQTTSSGVVAVPATANRMDCYNNITMATVNTTTVTVKHSNSIVYDWVTLEAFTDITDTTDFTSVVPLGSIMQVTVAPGATSPAVSGAVNCVFHLQ